MFTDIHNFMKDGVQLRQLLTEINECDFNDPQEAHAFGSIYESILKLLQSAGSSGEFYTPRALTDFMARHVGLKLGDKVADFACGTGGFIELRPHGWKDRPKPTPNAKFWPAPFTERKRNPCPICSA